MQKKEQKKYLYKQHTIHTYINFGSTYEIAYRDLRAYQNMSNLIIQQLNSSHLHAEHRHHQKDNYKKTHS